MHKRGATDSTGAADGSMDVMTTEENHRDESNPFNTVATIIAETCDIPREKITPDSHAINDLGIDSLDFLIAAKAA
jgi:hypothetical protein